MEDRLRILDVPVDRLTMKEALNKIDSFVSSEDGKLRTVVTLNAEMVVMADTDPEFKAIVDNSDLVVGDGSGIVWASRLMGIPLPERVTGIDLITALLGVQDKDYTFFFYGSAPGIVDQAAEKLKNAFPGLVIVGTQHGYIDQAQEEELIQQINLAKPDIIFVALGAPRQEKWIWENRERLNAKVAIGVGGSFDVLSGNKERAPEWMKNNGLEWLYRVAKEPTRIKRIMNLPRFAAMVFFKELLGKTKK